MFMSKHTCLITRNRTVNLQQGTCPSALMGTLLLFGPVNPAVSLDSLRTQKVTSQN